MHIIYIDDSRDEKSCAFSAIAIPSIHWKENFSKIKQYRRQLKDQYGIYVYKEFHATDFVAGRGKIADRVIFKSIRCKIFRETMDFIAKLTDVRIFNAFSPQEKEKWAFERLLNRINRAMKAWGSEALLICDNGKENEYTRLVRKMGAFNPIPSKYGTWQDGKPTANITLDLIIEDPIFKDSKKSFFVQMADFCAFSLLRMENQIPSRNRYGIHEAFDFLNSVLVREACPNDPKGIIRI